MAEKKLILVLDDDEPILELLTQALELEGYAVVTAANGLEGLDRLAELSPTGGKEGGGKQPPDLILCDVMMPEMDGVTFCRSLQDNPVYRTIPVVLITAAATATYMGKCQYSYIVRKPFDLDELLEIVAGLLN